MPEKHSYLKLKKRIQDLEQAEIENRKNEKVIQERLMSVRAVVDDAPLLICRYLPGGEISFVNKAYCDYFGKTLDELVGSNFLSLIPEDDQKTVMDNISALTNESPIQSHEHSVIAIDNDIRWQRWTNRAIFDDTGKVVEYQSIGEDITMRKRAEEALRESEELHRITLASISDAVFITDDAGIFTYICPNVSRIFGYTYDEVSALGNIEKLLGINHEDLNELKYSGEINNRECLIKDKSGVSHTLLLNVKIVSIKGGTILYTCRDITERKRAHQVMMESEEKYRQLFNSESDAVMIFDAQSNQFEDANPATLELFGYSKGEFVRLKVEDISAERAKTKDSVEKVKNGDTNSRYVSLRYFKKKNGAIFPGEIYAGTFVSKGRKKIIGAVRDISARMQAEEAIRKLSFSLLAAQEMERKRIALELHDDLGQSLALLKLKLENTQNKLPETLDNLRDEFSNSLKDATDIIEKVRNLSHGLSPSILDDLGLTVSLESLVDDFSKYAHINIRKDIENIDKLFSPIDKITIYRIFQEIFTNIEKHSKADEVKIKIKKYRANVSFWIEDNGKGFDLKMLDLKYPNEIGLGLASTEERVRMLGGRFEIKSQLNRGTKLYFKIPI